MNTLLRPATDADYEFIYNLKRQTIKEYVAAIWGWDEAFQRAHFAERFKPHLIQIVVFDDRDVGLLSLEEQENALFLAGIFILPDYQGQGVGTELIKDVIKRAQKMNKPVTLDVLKGNPACRLYERMGFKTFEVTETRYKMRRELDFT